MLPLEISGLYGLGHDQFLESDESSGFPGGGKPHVHVHKTGHTISDRSESLS